MPRTLSSGFVNALMARSTGQAFLWCIDIDHDDLDNPLRFVNNNEDISVNGNTYTAYGFKLRPPEDQDGSPRQAVLEVDNVNQWLTPTIRQLTGSFRVTLRLVTVTDGGASPPEYDNVVIEYQPLEADTFEINAFTARARLGYENIAQQAFPAYTFTPGIFRGLF